MRRPEPFRRLCAAALFLLLLSGCARTSAPPKITLVLKTTVETAEFWAQVMKGVHAAADELGVDLTVTGSSSETAVDEQIGIVKDVIADKPDAMILVASDCERLASVTDEAVAAGIPVVTMDSDVNSPRRAAYVASDNKKIGRSLGELLGQFLPNGGKVAILTHSVTASSGIDRTQGARDVIGQAGKYDLLGVFNCENDLDTARALTADLLEKHPDVDAILCTNEVCNIGVARTLTQEGLCGRVTVIGCDNSWRQIQYLEQNTIQGIVIQRPFNMGYLAVEQAVKVARGEEVDEFTEVGCVTITRDNMYNSDNQKLLFPFN